MKFILFALLCIAVLTVPAFSQNTTKAKVVGVVDGDTVTVLTKENRQIMVRLNGIDAPEKDQEFGSESKQFLSNLVLTQNVTISDLKDDCLNRTTGRVNLSGKDLSLLVIKSGNAWLDSDCQTDEALAKEEKTARENKVGLWQNLSPVKPSEFRKQKENQTQAQNNQTSGRRIFAGLAPAPPLLTPKGKPSGLSIGMELFDFYLVCGRDGKKSEMYSSEGYQSFDITIPSSERAIAKGCSGKFTFKRTSSDSLFELSSALQEM